MEQSALEARVETLELLLLEVVEEKATKASVASALQSLDARVKKTESKHDAPVEKKDLDGVLAQLRVQSAAHRESLREIETAKRALQATFTSSIASSRKALVEECRNYLTSISVDALRGTDVATHQVLELVRRSAREAQSVAQSEAASLESVHAQMMRMSKRLDALEAYRDTVSVTLADLEAKTRAAATDNMKLREAVYGASTQASIDLVR